MGQEGLPLNGEGFWNRRTSLMEECTVQQCAAQFSFLQCSVFQCGSDLEGCSAENEAGEKCLNRQGKGSAMAKQRGEG